MFSASSTVTKRGRTVIPAAIREAFGIKAGDTLAWISDGQGVRVVVIPSDTLGALYGRGQGKGLLAKSLEDRRIEREHDR